MRTLLTGILLSAMALPVLAAPASTPAGKRLDEAREAYLGTLARPISAADWEARYRTSSWFWEAGPSSQLGRYDAVIKEVSLAQGAPDGQFKRRALWVRPYSSDAIDLRVLEVLDRAQAMGVTEVYLETFYHGRVSYVGSKVFPARWPKLNVARVYAREAKHRGIKLFAWVHALRWGEDQVASGWAEGVLNGFGDAPQQAEGVGSAFVSPSSPAVRERLVALTDEIARLGYFDGVWLDYLRYPLAARSRPTGVDPRDFWGYSPSSRAALRTQAPALDAPAFRAFLADGTSPDEATRQQWLSTWRGFLAGELKTLLEAIRTRLDGRLKLGLVFHPSGYMRQHDPRAQDALAWLPLCDEVSPMCYAYDPEVDPLDASAQRATIDQELSLVEDAVAALPGKRPALLVALAGEPQPGLPNLTPPRRHWPLRAQIAYLKGRRVEGAFPLVDGVAMFSYGWLWPSSDASRRSLDEPAWNDAGRADRAPL
ncbi:MAG: hypothetical protein VKS61_15900 [Candidatus Sericytochromatia bacterium]|nr:hypothetical protein [Candidatus Sericytochromatia bacterium]